MLLLFLLLHGGDGGVDAHILVRFPRIMIENLLFVLLTRG